MTNSNQCPLCDGTPGSLNRVAGGENIIYHVVCPTCGRFEVSTGLIDLELRRSDFAGKRHLLSAVTKSQPGLTVVDLDLIQRVREGQIAEKTVEEKLDLVLQTYAGKSKEIGEYCVLDPAGNYPLAWCRSGGEWRAIVDALASEFGYLIYHAASGKSVQVTVKGWKWLADRPKAKGDIGFIAMAFHRSLDPVKKAI